MPKDLKLPFLLFWTNLVGNVILFVGRKRHKNISMIIFSVHSHPMLIKHIRDPRGFDPKN